MGATGPAGAIELPPGALVAALTNSVVCNATIGGWERGDIVSSGTTFQQFVEKLVRVRHVPTVSPATLTLSSTAALSQEVGSSIVFNLQATYNRGAVFGGYDNSGVNWEPGELQGYAAGELNICYIDDVSVGNVVDDLTLTGVSLQFTEGLSKTYYAYANLASGISYVDSYGDPLYSTYLNPSTVTSQITFTAYRKLFYGLNLNSAPTSADIRALPNHVNGPYIGMDPFYIGIPAGTSSVVIACPPGITISNILWQGVNSLSLDLLHLFSTSSIYVPGANNQAHVIYTYYYYKPADGFSQSAVYKVII